MKAKQIVFAPHELFGDTLNAKVGARQIGFILTDGGTHRAIFSYGESDQYVKNCNSEEEAKKFIIDGLDSFIQSICEE